VTQEKSNGKSARRKNLVISDCLAGVLQEFKILAIEIRREFFEHYSVIPVQVGAGLFAE
jgi:hypothetical protein